ncbi:MAG: MBL fold metallo-hydrolase [Candidatus Methanofastidiosia archaeon]
MSVTIKWLAHASFQIKGEGKTIYIDLEKETAPSEKADIILVTHSHYDHCDPSKIKKVRTPETVVIAPKDCGSKIEGDITSLKPGEETTVEGIHIKAVEAYNYKRFREPGKPYHPKELGVGYIITIGGKKVYHAGDTDFIPEMKDLNVDVAMLPSGGTYTMDNPEAAEAAVAINPGVAIPMHMWDTDPQEFKKKVEAVSSVNVVVFKKGEEYTV